MIKIKYKKVYFHKKCAGPRQYFTRFFELVIVKLNIKK